MWVPSLPWTTNESIKPHFSHLWNEDDEPSLASRRLVLSSGDMVQVEVIRDCIAPCAQGVSRLSGATGAPHSGGNTQSLDLTCWPPPCPLVSSPAPVFFLKNCYYFN